MSNKGVGARQRVGSLESESPENIPLHPRLLCLGQESSNKYILKYW